MGVLLLALVFLFALSRFGRIGPFVWAGPPRRFGPPPWMHHGASLPEGNAAPVTGPGEGEREPGCGARPPMSFRPDPERILAHRLADGQISPDDYLERLSLIQSHG